MNLRILLVAFIAALAFCATPVGAQRTTLPLPVATGEVRVQELPHEAQATISLIRRGGPYPYAKDGVVFGNREGVLPRQKRGYYREYTVKTPGVRSRGARRIVAGASGELYYSDDHYNHFRRIRE